MTSLLGSNQMFDVGFRISSFEFRVFKSSGVLFGAQSINWIDRAGAPLS